jgi:hypothetical protein
MKSLTAKLLPLLILFTISATAQINSGVGYMHGTYKKGDTAIDYHDEPYMHDHEHVKIIKETKLTPDQAAKLEGKPAPASKSATAAAPDTIHVTDTIAQAAAPDTAATPSSGGMIENTLITAVSGCACINVNFLWAALALIGLGLLIDLYLLLQTMRDQKRSGFASALHGLLASAGMTLLITYSVFNPAPIISLVCLVIAVLLGVVLLYNDVSAKPSSKGLAIVQAVIAVLGVVLLAVFACSHP